jgi:UDP-N-acetylglucosamine 4,6-dehydratase
VSVLIIGGSGFFGRAFARAALSVFDRVCIYSRSEWLQAQMRAEFNDDPKLRWFIGDVRDLPRLRLAMEGVDTVIHAAALKRIEVGHYNPVEMVKTNVGGAMNVIEAAQTTHDLFHRPRKVIALSTDKAYQAVSPYGQSKSLAESLFLAANNTRAKDGPIFSVVRYGNIFASTGSVVPYWKSLVAKGKKKVPLTDPECTRFFMRIEEAVSLVFQTLDTMKGGELVIPNWLPAYRLGDLAEAMGVDYEVTGLPDYEKRDESMREGLCSATARRMSVEELRTAVNE